MEKTAAGCSLGAQTWDAVWMVFLWVMMKFHSHVSRSITASRDKKESSRSPVYFVPSRKLGFNHAVIKFLYGRLSFTQQHFQAACSSMLSPAPCMRPRHLLLQPCSQHCRAPSLLFRADLLLLHLFTPTITVDVRVPLSAPALGSLTPSLAHPALFWQPGLGSAVSKALRSQA